jgi:anti-sigma-K factor RskA
MKYQDPQLVELLAAEYVLGTLKGRARQRFEKLLQAHPALRQRVQSWELRLNQLASFTPPIAPAGNTWDVLQQRLFPPKPRQSRFQQLAFWRNLSLGSGLLAGILAVLLLLVPALQEVPGYIVIINNTQSQQPVWMISTSADMTHFYVKNITPINAAKDIRCMLWLQPRGSQHFYSLGVLPDEGNAMTLPVDEAIRPMLPGQLLVTVEEANGPMPAKPTRPPQYEGKWMPLESI